MATEHGSEYYLSHGQESAVDARYDAQTTACMEERAELKRFNPEDPNSTVSRENLYEEMADVQMRFIEIYDLKSSDLRRMTSHKVWRMKQKAG